mmetsp:Transcript_15735/g.17516  ORF Transcript_15735/g.17516 Transcript_15735/m.17516 type:complete len:128 (+) Transcript_15735:57-440(+)
MEPKKETKPLFMIDNVAEDILKSTNRELCKQHMINNRSRFTEALRVEMEKIIHKDYVSFDKADKKEYFPVYDEEDGVEFRDSSRGTCTDHDCDTDNDDINLAVRVIGNNNNRTMQKYLQQAMMGYSS